MGEGNTDGIFEGYKKNEDISLSSYGVLAGVFNAIFAAFLLVSRGREVPAGEGGRQGHSAARDGHPQAEPGRGRGRGHEPPARPVHRASGEESPKKVDEEPRGEGLRRSVGELLTCKFCLGVWLASFFTYGLVLVPRVTRLVATIFAVVTISDHLHQAYKALMNRA
jgi:hypothetical protein